MSATATATTTLSTHITYEENRRTILSTAKITRNQLIARCKEQGIRGVSNKSKAELIHILEQIISAESVDEEHKSINYENDTKDINDIMISPIVSDHYTKDILRRRYTLHKNYVSESMDISRHTKITFRLPSIPEDISENLIKFIIQRTHDPTSTWNTKKSGDLFSQKEGKQECKCFTSVGPISFTPSSIWDVIYFLDATRWLDDNFALYRVPLKMDSPEWKAIQINKKETFGDQSQQGRRPRIGWSYLLPQLNGYCEKIAEGTFEGIMGDIINQST